MTKAEVFEKVKKFIVDEFKVSEDQIKDEASFLEDLGFDSLDVSTLVQDVENMFDIRIPDEDLDKLTTVGELVNYVAEKKA
ncbi:MAG: Acyl carrier protein [Candidatus Aminicenantes bacterium ADurb.Bin508]|jgi:acyl carrier protein|nr:MAG: Acyl carrier protein [Candidatus Aminicenantes bacterium ADurb.Bin508]HNX41311.1 acyl carrier protein [Candidatus Aminicenantes bacterium]HPB56133.1 acyl carrier protein [Candidatus Aminicenantes bacterium]HPS99480.1 acyl carrier protein [Candidatus Aminicenantes bacterium]